tara:strand:+ start:636 stop:1220 length:585 start_codon:yes stop_codon:yes gene_type:complete
MKPSSLFVILILLSISSCSWVGKKIGEAYYDAGWVNTSFNQNPNERLAKGEKVLFGQFKVFLKGEDITDQCSVTFGSGFSRGGTSLKDNPDGNYLYVLDEKESHLSGVLCNDSQGYKLFHYYFKEYSFNLLSSVNYFGLVQLNFVPGKIDEKYKYHEFMKYSILSLTLSNPPGLQEKLRVLFQLPESKYFSLIP